MEFNTIIRNAKTDEVEAIVALVVTVVGEIYGTLFEGPPPVSTNAELWNQSLVAVCHGQIVGVGLAEGRYIDDLWVLAKFRGRKIGARLLSRLEDQISSEGHDSAFLRVVADNDGARRFYIRHGWREARTYPHERDGYLVVDLQKRLLVREQS